VHLLVQQLEQQRSELGLAGRARADLCAEHRVGTAFDKRHDPGLGEGPRISPRPLPGRPKCSSFAAVSGRSSTVPSISAATGALVRVINGSSYEFKDPFALTSFKGRIWVANAGDNSVTEVSASTGTLVRVIRGSN
jgi:hypothetical protein